MITKVFQDLKYFISFFLIFIIQFGLIFTVLFRAAPVEEYEGVDAFGYYLMIFRIAAGDFATDNYKDQSQFLVIITWIVWIIAVIALNIIFMNFIVAVISESYEKVMQKIVAETFKVKCQEGKLAQKAKKTVRQCAMINIGEWQGFIKDIKNTIKTTATRAKNETLQNLSLIQSTNQILMEQLKHDTNKQFYEMRAEFKKDVNEIQDTLKQRMDGLELLVKDSLSKLLENASKQQQ
ncbi:UNKNOWN [Stylonychia lemnae]|uniref:Ion transport domain-containing protein n=1 Tax=Stylonychia lemnae TaxID=5949 RepID=A0A077ZPL5_STYLE|nr:UNKNOWN [Stylonychia lemnae]|eukprot:CDW71404.1 UNKNOWN [Stylonychia lemnae]